MIRRNKLSIFLLAVVMMLSVYYINMPDSSTGDVPTGGGNVVTRYPDFAMSRLELLEEREEQVAVLEEIMASIESSEVEKNVAYTQMQILLGYTEKELLAEKFVMDLGFVDCFVCYDETLNVVSVEILNYKFEYLVYEEISRNVAEMFGGVQNVLIFENES